jgi:hypothetical protein
LQGIWQAVPLTFKEYPELHKEHVFVDKHSKQLSIKHKIEQLGITD